MEYKNEPAFINRQEEMAYIQQWIEERPKNILFFYGPKSSGKTTLIYKFVDKYLSDENKFSVKLFNLREVLIVNYEDLTGGSVNYCLNALAQKGLIKIGNFTRSKKKTSYTYLLTAEGLEQKTKATYHFLKRKLQEYEELKAEIDELKKEVDESSALEELDPHCGKKQDSY